MGVNARAIKVGLNIATSGSWGTGTADATAVGSGDGLYVRDHLEFQMQRQLVEDDSAGQDYIGAVQVANMTAVEGKIPLHMHYFDTFLNPMWALAFGTGDTSPNQLNASTAYTGTFAPATNKTGLYCTIVTNKSQDVYEVSGAKCTGFEIRSAENGRMELDFFFLGDMEIEGSSINDTTQTDALTFPTLGKRWFFHQIVFRINAQAGGALGSSDAHSITSLRVKFEQPLDTMQSGGQTTIVEPEESGFPTCEIEVTFARYDADSLAFFAGQRIATPYKADLTFSGPIIGALATSYALFIEFPNVYIPDDGYTSVIPGGSGQVAPTTKYRCLSTTAAPTGMTGTGLLFMITTGERSADPFT